MDEFDRQVQDVLEAVKNDDPNVGLPALIKLVAGVARDIRRTADTLERLEHLVLNIEERGRKY